MSESTPELGAQTREERVIQRLGSDLGIQRAQTIIAEETAEALREEVLRLQQENQRLSVELEAMTEARDALIDGDHRERERAG
jgi:hypothetical protein